MSKSQEVPDGSPGCGGPWEQDKWSEAKDAEAQLLRELRDSVELLLREQECKVRRFTDTCLRSAKSIGEPDPAFVDNTPPWQREPAVPSAAQPSEGSGLKMSASRYGLSRGLTLSTYRQHLVSNWSVGFGNWGDQIRQTRTSSTNFLKSLAWRIYYFFQDIEEPEPSGCLGRFIRSPTFELMTLSMIIINGALTVYLTDRHARLALENPTELGSYESLENWDAWIQNTFALYFTVEVMLKLWVHKFYFFCNADWLWNAFDLLTITVTLIELAMVLVRGDSDESSDLVFLRTLRVFRATRALRVLRALHFVRNLRQLMECMVSSLSQVFWCMVLLVFLTGVFATFLLQNATAFWMEEGGSPHNDEQEADLVNLRAGFGSMGAAMFSLFQATTGGDDWGKMYHLLTYTGPANPIIFLLYILFFIIAAWNIVTSLFIEKALALAQPDLDSQVLEKRRKDIADAKDLMGLMKAMDDSNSGTISLDAFKMFLDQPRFRAFFEIRNIDIRDMEMFFRMLRTVTDNDEIKLDMLVNGLLRMRGVATNIDLQMLQFQFQIQSDAQVKSIQSISQMLDSILTDLQPLSQSSTSFTPKENRTQGVRTGECSADMEDGTMCSV
mmetsp:Transcript_844/g.2352  ORF Transcript_844/g.2352 Transcript_844/m.2352 type:complete len:612 (+) Transcript_844:58-1893(+)